MEQLDVARGRLEEYLRRNGISTTKPFSCLNPHHEDKHPSMSYNRNARNVHCFACGATYDIFDLIGFDYALDTFREQCLKWSELFPETPARGEKKKDAAFILEDRILELKDLESRSNGDTRYFESRGITGESIRKYRLFQCGGRAYFPLFQGGNCIGWTARAENEGMSPRYKNSGGSLGIWNGDLLSQNGAGKRLFITEGVIDAICLEQMGENAVALCGSQNSEKLLAGCGENPETAVTWQLVACGDPDTAGRQMNRKLYEGLKKMGLSCTELVLKPEDRDVAWLYLNRRDRLQRLLMEPCCIADGVDIPLPVSEGLDDFFLHTRSRHSESTIATGFSFLDKLLDGGLFPGLYVIGAISSLGKTSFALQISDHIAGSGTTDVLFFSLEQSRFELIAKSLSRISAGLASNRVEPFTVRWLLKGVEPENPARKQLLENTREIYMRSAPNLYLYEGISDIGVAEIREAVRAHRERKNAPLVVVVDYLQILKPSDPRATDKQNTDRAVVELKRISRDFHAPVIVVSSFNRENYRTAVNMEAFKESGAVEYSSDVLLGLQLMGAGTRDFDVNTEKCREPRRIDLVMLKNRNGIPYAKHRILYHARYGLFEEKSPFAGYIPDK